MRTIAQAFRRAAAPLAAYYTVTLAMPLAHGAGGRAFAEHAMVVAVIPVMMILFVAGVTAVGRIARHQVTEPKPLKRGDKLMDEGMINACGR